MKMFDVWKLVVPVIFALMTSVSCKRQTPRDDEIERIVNETHSRIWKCTFAECPPGSGLNVGCGSSIPFNESIQCVACKPNVSYSETHDYSPCKKCSICRKHEEKSGKCTVEKDTTRCLGACEKGYYWQNGTCYPCSECCGKNFSSYHETQCERSLLPISHQCRKTDIICVHPTTPAGHQDQSSSSHFHEDKGKKLSGLQIVLIAIFIVLAIVIALWLVMWKVFGWQEAKTKLQNWFCFVCHSLSACVHSTQMHSTRQISDLNHDISVASTSQEEVIITWTECEMPLEEVTDKKHSLKSAPSIGKRPRFQRLFSAPAEFCKVKTSPKIPRSVSHPGCLKDLNEPQQEANFVSMNKSVYNRRTKKVGKKQYVSLPMNQEETDSVDPATPDVQKNGDPRKLSPPAFNQTQSTSTTGLYCGSGNTIQSVPADFQSKLLGKGLESIPVRFYNKICIKLNTKRDLGDDYHLLGEKICLDKDEVLLLAQTGNPTKSMMEKYDSKKGSSIGKFQKILEGMERNDVVTVIDEWIVHEWNVQCSSSCTGNI